MSEQYPDFTGKKILVLAKHDTIGHAMKLNLEYILHVSVLQYTLNRENSYTIPEDVIDFGPDVVLVAEPADICNIDNLIRSTPWLLQYESLPFLVLCVQPESYQVHRENIHYLQFPYEQDELHAKLSSILYQPNIVELKVNKHGNQLQTSVLIVENEWIVASDLESILNQYGYQVTDTVTSASTVFDIAKKTKPDIIFMDLHLQKVTDSISSAQIIQTDLDIPVIFIASFADQKYFESADSAHPFGHVLKPFDEREIHTAVEIALYKKQMERELHKRTEELQERNAELAAFAWAVANEIRDPINITRDFSELLIDSHTPLAEDEVRYSLGMIRDLTLGVQDTVDNLLLLTTLRESKLALEPVNMAEIVNRAQSRLSELKQRYNAEIIQLGPWPDAIGHSQWVEEIWVKFISSAIRFGGKPPKLTIGATKQKDQIHFWVKDNGPEIKDEEKRFLLSPFPPPQSAHRYNTSLGLTVVSRIASRLGSELSIESKPGYGNTFAFTLPVWRHSHVSLHQ